MKIIILNTNSFGGNYEYSRCLAKAYTEHADVESCLVLIPENAIQQETEVFKKVLLSDISSAKNVLFRKLYFVFRSLINPFRIYSFLKKAASSTVIFNDYDQLTSFVWIPFFRSLRNKHTFAVILHDADRDHYLPLRTLSVFTMKKFMSIIDIAFYHEVLPDKTYYHTAIPKVNVPHGIYEHPTYDQTLFQKLLLDKGSDKMLGILGNIRDEKNYTFIIDCLPQLPNTKLLIAGSPSSAGVQIEFYKNKIEELNLQERVIWIEKRLTDDEFQSAVKVCDLILLYYKSSFTSQSGILNLIAPHKKCVLVSNNPSGLHKSVHDFEIGVIATSDKLNYIESVQSALQKDSVFYATQWDSYMNYASWENHVQIVLDSIQNIHNK